MHPIVITLVKAALLAVVAAAAQAANEAITRDN
jgi:hypothetical protein